jgi:hypothetical protein
VQLIEQLSFLKFDRETGTEIYTKEFLCPMRKWYNSGQHTYVVSSFRFNKDGSSWQARTIKKALEDN